MHLYAGLSILKNDKSDKNDKNDKKNKNKILHKKRLTY